MFVDIDTLTLITKPNNHLYMDKKIKEKRLIKRQQLKSYLQVYNRKTGKPIGYIVNLSSEGLRLVSNIPLLTHSVFEFRVKLPREVNGAKHIDFDALSCWCRPDVSPDSFDTGFKIVDAPQELHNLVNGLTNYFSFKSESSSGTK
jgi:hypothetical protein